MTVTASMSFSEVADALNKAIVEIQDKKKIFDSASEAVAKASNAYQKSVDDAQFLRSELEKSLNDSMGDKSNAGRVRISG